MSKSTNLLSQNDNYDISWINKDTKCWVYFPNKQQGDIYIRGTVQKIIPLNFNKGNSNVKGILQNGIQFQTKAYFLEKSRQSRSIQRDLIQMDIINGAEVLNQLKKRFQDKKIHTYLWNSIIIVNPFQLVQKNYGQKVLEYYYENMFLKQNISLIQLEPHIYSFIFNILKNIKNSSLYQVLSISGQSGSGKTQTNKQCLKAISYCCQLQKIKSQNIISDHNMQLKILRCDPILQAFGNSKTVKNDNSSRFGKLINIKIDPGTMSIQHSSIRNYFLQKSRIISQSTGQRNFHIFYLFLKFLPDHEKAAFKLKTKFGGLMKLQDFQYISQKKLSSSFLHSSEKQMWQQLLKAFRDLQFKKQTVNQIWSVISAILLLGNIAFDGLLQNQNDPCQIINIEVVTNISILLKIPKQQLEAGLIFNKKNIAGELMYLPLTSKQCQQGRDSIAKALYEGLFSWIVDQLNRKVNNIHDISQIDQCRQIKLLDIYGFQVFQKNSFEQLCVNFTNEKIHQIYLQQVFIHQKKILKNQGLQSSIPSLNFTDNFKIIQLLQSSTKSIFNLLDQSCTLNVRDIDFLANIRKIHQNHQHFPSSNLNNIRNSFIIKHTPGDIEYLVEGFRDKNKDLLRQQIVLKLAQSQIQIVKKIFLDRAESIKIQSTKKYLGIKIRKQIKQLINQMSFNSNLHFVRCIKPNQFKKAFNFIERVCYNQIKYLGILDTIQMRKESYHVRMTYKQFFLKYGILQDNINSLISLQNGSMPAFQCRQLSMRLLVSNKLTSHKLQYLFGRQKIFMKMSTKNFLDLIHKRKTKYIQHSSLLIQASYKMFKKLQLKKNYKKNVPKIQNAVRNFLTICKLSKKKKAVLIIEAYWIKYCLQFFMRKKRKHIITVQKYMKKTIQMFKQIKKADAMLKIKQLIKSINKTNKQKTKFQNFLQLKKIIKNDIYDKIWTKITLDYISIINKYMKTYITRKKNKQYILTSQRTALFRQNIKNIKNIENYFKGLLMRRKSHDLLSNIRKIQKYLRMSKIRSKFINLKQNAIRIQRAWREYCSFKNQNINRTKKFFQAKIMEEKQNINEILFRNIQRKNYGPDKYIENVLHCQQKIKREKINLFYYLIDFQMFCDLSYIYPDQSWIENYCELFKSSIQKGNPIQYLDISSTHTVCTTINKVYQWGQIRQQNQIRTQKYYENIPTPNNRVAKIKACDGFTIIETQDPQELLIIGDQKQYQQSSIKQWSTLTQSFVLLNGVILTLNQSSLIKLSISDKVTHLSCGMNHVLCKTSLKRVYSWGQNKMGQLGHGNYKRVLQPKNIDFISKNKIIVNQIGATAHGSVILDMNCKLWWFGSNGTIEYQCLPKQALLNIKSQFIDNQRKYSLVRIIPKWSKSISLIGVTIALYDGAFKPTQTAIRKKCMQNLMTKWVEDIQTINPPYISSVSGNFSEKHMYFKKLESKKLEGQQNLTYQQIKNKLLNQMMIIQHAQKNLLKTIRSTDKSERNHFNSSTRVNYYK